MLQHSSSCDVCLCSLGVPWGSQGWLKHGEHCVMQRSRQSSGQVNEACQLLVYCQAARCAAALTWTSTESSSSRAGEIVSLMYTNCRQGVLVINTGKICEASKANTSTHCRQQEHTGGASQGLVIRTAVIVMTPGVLD
jgi:hypothetical protein